MISDTMQAALNDQINAELYSSYLYLSMAAYYQDSDLPGFANWMRMQTLEEGVHATMFFDFLIERGGRVLLQPIAGPPTAWDSPLAPFEQAYEHETVVTRRINDLVTLALEERDHATVTFLDWFVREQVEEEASALAIVKQLRMIGDDRGGLFMLDRELAARVFTPPAANAAG
ncbi:MAG TPA: ferritin [Armatimonadota bacterium]|nr:ferritin [Armatimonadota bacterium]